MQKAAGILLVPVYTTYMVPQQFGTLSVCLSLAAMIPVLFFASIYEAAYFSVLKHENDSQDTIAVVLMSELAIFIFMLTTVVILYITVPAGVTLFNIAFRGYILSTIVMASLSVFQLTINQVLVASERTGIFVISNLLAFISTISITLYLLIVEKQGVMSFILANSAVNFIYFMVAIGILKSHWRVRFVQNKVREIFKFTLPLVPHTMAHWTRAWVDRMLLSGIVTPSSAGVYHISTTYSGVMLPGIDAFRNANNPRFFSLIKGSDHYSDLSSILSVSLGGFSFLAIVLGAFSRELIELLTSQDYHEAYRCVPILLSAHLMYLVYINTVVVLFNAVKTRKIAAITIVTSIVSILVGYVLIKNMGINGAAISSFISNMLLAVIIYRECQLTAKLPWPIYKGFFFALLPLSLLCVDLNNLALKLILLLIAATLILITTFKDIKISVKS